MRHNISNSYLQYSYTAIMVVRIENILVIFQSM